MENTYTFNGPDGVLQISINTINDMWDWIIWTSLCGNQDLRMPHVLQDLLYVHVRIPTIQIWCNPDTKLHLLEMLNSDLPK